MKPLSRVPHIPVDLTRGPFHISVASRHGITEQQLRGATWRRLGGGFYAWREIADRPMTRLLAARQRLPGSALFSGRTAAFLHGLDESSCNPIEVTLPTMSGISHLAGLSVRRSDVPECERSTANGLPATSLVRTVAELGCKLGLIEAVSVIDMALHRRLLRADELLAWTATHSGNRGVARLRRAIELAEPATESVMETRLRLLLVLNGLPRPEVQVPLTHESGIFVGRPDLYYPNKRLALEYDGGTHRDSLASDDRRQNRLIEAGYRLLRFTAGDIFHTPAAVVALVRRALV